MGALLPAFDRTVYLTRQEDNPRPLDLMWTDDEWISLYALLFWLGILDTECIPPPQTSAIMQSSTLRVTRGWETRLNLLPKTE